MFRPLVNFAHHHLVFGRRTRRIAEAVAGFLPSRGRVLDVGAGDGTIGRLISESLPEVRVEGIDILVRPETKIPVRPFDGKRIPEADGSWDAVILVDVLHHTAHPEELLREVNRVSIGPIVIKDHYAGGAWSRAVLRFMDWVGNWGHRVVLPYNYLGRKEWEGLFGRLGLELRREVLPALYPFPASLVFKRSYQVVMLLEPKG